MGGVGLSVEPAESNVVRPAAFILPRIRAGRRTDLDALYEFECRIFVKDRATRRSIEHSLSSPSQVVLVAEIGKVIVGAATLWIGKRHARLYSIGVHPGHRNRWIGFLLMKKCERIAREHDCTVMRLEVRADNHGAIDFYRRNHYNGVGIRVGYYGDGTDALKLEKDL